MKAILIGKGEVIFFLTRLFISKGYEVAVITPDRDDYAHLQKHFKATIEQGDGTSPELLDKVEAKDAQILIAATNYDHMNLAACQNAIVKYGTPHTLAVVNDPDNVEIFKKLGIKYIFNKTDLIVSLLERFAESEYVTPLLTYAGGKMLFYEVKLTRSMPAVGNDAARLDIPRDASIMGIIRDGKFEMPDTNVVLKSDDRILLATSPTALAKSIRTLCGNIA